MKTDSTKAQTKNLNIQLHSMSTIIILLLKVIVLHHLSSDFLFLSLELSRRSINFVPATIKDPQHNGRLGKEGKAE